VTYLLKEAVPTDSRDGVVRSEVKSAGHLHGVAGSLCRSQLHLKVSQPKQRRNLLLVQINGLLRPAERVDDDQ